MLYIARKGQTERQPTQIEIVQTISRGMALDRPIHGHLLAVIDTPTLDTAEGLAVEVN
jgi:hypothetical protein